ncbi:MAG: hypothetical protein WC443_08005 [Desulfobaccales bacterium]
MDNPWIDHLLGDWYSNPSASYRGGLCYAIDMHGETISICPNDEGWSDPATQKLFKDIRNCGFGLKATNPPLGRREGLKNWKYITLVPPGRRQDKMDWPEPIWSHEQIGTREPGDPELRGYDPGHPWYYLLGGRPLRPEEIEPDREWELPSDIKLNGLKDPAKRRKRLIEMRQEYEKRLQADIERYLQVVTPGYEMSSYDRSMGYGLETSLFLCHNHVWSSKAWLAAINRKLGLEMTKANPLLGTDGRVEPIEIPQPAIPVRETHKPVPQAREQLRLF